MAAVRSSPRSIALRVGPGSGASGGARIGHDGGADHRTRDVGGGHCPCSTNTTITRPTPRRTRRRRLLRLPTLTLRPAAAGGLAALLLAIGIAAGVLIDSGSGNAPASADLVLSRIDDGPAGAHGDVLVAGDAREATLELAGLDPTGPDNFYELWLLDEDGRMIALGSFPVGGDGKAEIELPLPVEPSRYRYFDVSLQEDNGDPAHSGVSVLRGPTSS